MEKLKIVFNTGYLTDEIIALSKTLKLNEFTNEKDIVQDVFNYLDKEKQTNKIIRFASNNSIVFYAFRLYAAKNYENIDITYQFNFKNGKFKLNKIKKVICLQPLGKIYLMDFSILLIIFYWN